MENITLPTQLVNATLQYLATRPYQEVAALIAEIQKHGQAPTSQPTEETLQ